jgi:hypothetical protein
MSVRSNDCLFHRLMQVRQTLHVLHRIDLHDLRASMLLPFLEIKRPCYVRLINSSGRWKLEATAGAEVIAACAFLEKLKVLQSLDVCYHCHRSDLREVSRFDHDGRTQSHSRWWRASWLDSSTRSSPCWPSCEGDCPCPNWHAS